MPALEGLNKGYKSKGVQVLGVILDVRNADRAKKILQQTGAGFTNLLDDGTFSKKVFAVPQTYFVNGKGAVVYAVLGSRTEPELKAIVDVLLESGNQADGFKP